MQRVLVIGPGGAGKSTLARALGERTGLPVVHLDREYWQPGWVEPSKEAFDATVDELIAAERWILDGNFGRTFARRAAAADTILLLDPPPWRCVCSVLRRRLIHRGRARPDMDPGCPEKIDLDFVFWIWRYRRNSLPKTLATLEPLRASKTVLRFCARSDAYRWLEAQPALA